MRRVGCVLVLAWLVGCAAQPPAPPPHRVIVFFQEWSAALDPAAQSAVGAAATWAKEHPDEVVTVSGFADTTGSSKANEYISLTRAQVVSDQLAADGVAASRITIAGQGATSYALSSQESRRVEIAIGAR